ncbi:MAG: LPS-assembly protein LptD [Ferrovibrio sp.]|uniref:LPS-assembly protein LptD n=1 Tax=Ferrovibrio sp. TaxID=1917215 RepID=UPI00391DFD8A
MKSGRLSYAIIAGLLVFSAAAARAQNNDPPVLVTADTLKYDQSLGIVTAEGQVELVQGGRTLLADSVSYSEKDDKVTASGNVSLMEANGTVLFADYMELFAGMRNGFIRDAAMLLSDNSRGAAVSGERRDGNRTILRKAVYTTCSLCEQDPSRAPLWQLKGQRVEHNEAAQEIVYRDAVFEMFGIPIFYTPYFSHPDPTVNRRSGFLPPSYTNGDFFGHLARLPYYYVIDDQSDMTLTPQYSSKQGAHIAGEYRRRMTTGEMEFDGSITEEDETGDLRGHFRSNLNFRASDDVAWGANILRSSDDTYLSRYSIQNQPSSNTLTSRVYAEAINNRHFASLNAFSFQNLRSNVRNGTVPTVAPIMDYSAVFEPGDYGGRWALDANMASLFRTDGTDTRRLSTTASWSQPYFAPSGEVFTATAMLRADGYWVNDISESLASATTSDGADVTGRVIPAIALDWRYPLVRDMRFMRQLVEPIVMAVVTPYGGNPSTIPNEDSLSFEFDETNLFSLNRFPGYDRWDGGPKVNYGLRSAIYANNNSGYTELLVGQSLRAKSDDTFTPGSGLSERLSDYVARLTFSPGRYISIVDRVRLAQNSDLTVQRHELTTTLGTNTNYFSVSYAKLADTDFLQDIGDREAVSASLRAQMTKYWSTEVRHTRDLGDDGGALLNFAALRYTDECFDIVLFAQRNFTTNRDIQPATTVGIRFRIATFN